MESVDEPVSTPAIGSKVVTLDYPVKHPDGSMVTVIKLRRLTAKEMKGVDLQSSDGKIGSVLKFVAVMSGLPNSVMDQLDGADVMEIVGEASSFLARGTGAKPL